MWLLRKGIQKSFVYDSEYPVIDKPIGSMELCFLKALLSCGINHILFWIEGKNLFLFHSDEWNGSSTSKTAPAVLYLFASLTWLNFFLAMHIHKIYEHDIEMWLEYCLYWILAWLASWNYCNALALHEKLFIVPLFNGYIYAALGYYIPLSRHQNIGFGHLMLTLRF